MYCVEEEEKNGNCPRALSFMRRYLGVGEDSAIEKKIQEYLDKNPKERQKLDEEYQEWLDKNKEILEKSFQKQKVELPDASVKPTIDPKLVEYAKTFGWYKRNEKVNDVLNKLNERISISNQMKKLYSEKIRLTKEPSKVEEAKKELNELNDEIDLEMKLCSVIRKSDSEFIQEIFG